MNAEMHSYAPAARFLTLLVQAEDGDLSVVPEMSLLYASGDVVLDELFFRIGDLDVRWDICHRDWADLAERAS